MPTGFSPEDPADTPSGLKDPEKAAVLLGEAASRVKASYGSINVSWIEIYCFRRGNNDYPANGRPDHLGIFRTMYFEKDVDNKFRAVHGDTFHAVVEFGDNPRAMLLQAYGNSSRKGDRHNGDQITIPVGKKITGCTLQQKRSS